MDRAQKSWAVGKVTGVLLKDVKGAFDHVARSKLVQGLIGVAMKGTENGRHREEREKE